MYRLHLGALDEWCYLAPGAVADRPLHIKAPLLGDFLGADHVWGIHWPGAPLLYSCVFAVVPWSPLTRVLLFMGLAFAVVAVTNQLLRWYLQDARLAVAGSLIVLVDRMMHDTIGLARPETLSTLVFTGLVLLIARWEVLPSSWRNWRQWGIGLSFFLLPLLHPVLSLTGGMLAVYQFWRAWQSRRVGQGCVFALCYALGILAFASWFYWQPDAARQLSIHAKANYRPFAWGGTFLEYLGLDRPLYMIVPVYLLALVGCAKAFSSWREAAVPPSPQAGSLTGGQRSTPSLLLPAVVLLGSTLAGQRFHNPYYQLLVLPEAVLLAIAGCQWLARRAPRPQAAAWIYRGLIILMILHAEFWVPHVGKFFLAGRPDMRGEIRALVHSLPPAQTVLIPVSLWEEGVRQPNGFFFYTLPFASAAEVRKSYEAQIFDRMRPGDLLLHDEHDTFKLTTPPPPAQWEKVRRYEHHLPSQGFAGYEMTLYRKR